MRVVLLGFMGAGKSSVAKELSSRLGFELIELDQVILSHSGLSSIDQIFKSGGEARFRELERAAIENLSPQSKSILSPGGGFIETSQNIELLKEMNFKFIYLSASFDALKTRAALDKGRPLFENEADAFSRFLKRIPIYDAISDYRIETDQKSVQEVSRAAEEFIAGGSALAFKPTLPKNSILVIGDPISQSLSPAVHNAAFKHLGLADNFHMLSTRVTKERLSQTISIARQLYRGVTCTIPHKVAVIADLEELDDAASKIGAVNTIVNSDGSLKGYNTDWLGLRDAICELTDLQGKKTAIIGAGGTARSAIFACLKGGAKVSVFNRTLANAEKLGLEFGVEAFPLSAMQQLRSFEIIINTTSLGSSSHAPDLPIAPEVMHAAQIVMDVNYNPELTALLKAAGQKGARTIAGSRMFLYQALHQFKLYTDLVAPRDVMENMLRTKLLEN